MIFAAIEGILEVDGTLLGTLDALIVGSIDKTLLGFALGRVLGAMDGTFDASKLGCKDGASVGVDVGGCGHREVGQR